MLSLAGAGLHAANVFYIGVGQGGWTGNARLVSPIPERQEEGMLADMLRKLFRDTLRHSFRRNK